jgi:autotransporter-associated beta strand protein
MLLDYVKRSGDQTAAGNKTFTGMTRLEGGVYIAASHRVEHDGGW